MDKVSIQYFHGRDGVKLAYHDIGQGRPLVLFHGYMGSAQQSWIANGYAARLAALGHRLILPDLRGHGQSDKPHEPTAYPPDVLAEDGLALLEQLELDDYDLGGYSLGARVTLRLLARQAAPRRAILGGQGLDVTTPVTGRANKYRDFFADPGTLEPGSEAWKTATWLRQSGGDPLAQRQILNTFVNTPDEALAQIKVPVLVLVGTEDERSGGDCLATLLGNGRFQAIPGNHLSAFLHPLFLAAISDFLASPPA